MNTPPIWLTASMKAQQSKVSKQLTEEIQPMQHTTAKLYKTMAGQYTEKMLKKKVLDRALKQIVGLNKKQAKEERAIVAEMEQLRDRAKAKAEKLLDPAVLNAKFAKQKSASRTVPGDHSDMISISPEVSLSFQRWS
ncbi:hypothetical protein QFC24_001791 [Naganishia onofrii]|uniref:Uncharacterized protein n=1 Tax=Naganishia onofrii TaxID=1851511 RepID=A0ACC2XRW4_9TREE|nr:hypothetical protein QFC24_001791 [Naganishia onofrii]